MGGRRRRGAPDRGRSGVLAERPAGRRGPLLHRHRRLGGRVPGLRRRAGRADDRRARRRADHGRDHLGVGRQPDARRGARLRHRVHALGHGDRRRQGPGELRSPARPARARHDLPEHHAGRGEGRLGDRADRGPEGQDGLRRLAELRHRGDRAAAAAGRRARPGRGHRQARARRRRVGAGAARRLDRRVLLVGRRPDGRDHRPRRRPTTSACSRSTPTSIRCASATGRPTRRRRSRRASTAASRPRRRSGSRTS